MNRAVVIRAAAGLTAYLASLRPELFVVVDRGPRGHLDDHGPATGHAPQPRPLTGVRSRAARSSATDVFYDLEEGRNEAWQARGILGVEMEAAVLFALAARHGARAGCVLTVSNQLVGAKPGWLDAKDRERAGVDACRVALDALVATT